MKKEIDKLKIEYDKLCNEWIKLFCKKQGIEFDFWIGDEIGGIASFICQYYFTIDNIIFDLTTNQPKGLILNWQIDEVEHNSLKDDKDYINYSSYSKGIRHKDL